MEQTEQQSSAVYSARPWYVPFLYGVGVVLFLLFLGAFAYAKSAVHGGATDAAVVGISRVFRIPAASVNGKKIYFADVVGDIEVLRKYYKAVPSGYGAPTEDDLISQALARRIADVIISDMAKEYKVSVSSEEINKAFEEQMQKNGGDTEAARKELFDTFGLSPEQFKQKAIRPVLLQEKTREAYLVSTGEDAKIKAKAVEVLEKAKAGDDFAALAAEFGSDGTKTKGGDLGYFAKGDMVKEFEDAVFGTSSKLGVLPDLVKTEYGYHVVKIEDKTTTTTPDGSSKELVRARHILFPSDAESVFSAVVMEKLKGASVDIFVDTWKNPFAEKSENGVENAQVPAGDATGTAETAVDGVK